MTVGLFFYVSIHPQLNDINFLPEFQTGINKFYQTPFFDMSSIK